MQFKQYLLLLHNKLLVVTNIAKQYLLLKILAGKIIILSAKKYIFNYLIKLLIFIDQQLSYYRFVIIKLKKYLLYQYNKLFFFSDLVLRFFVRSNNNIKDCCNKYLLFYKKNLLKIINLIDLFKIYCVKKSASLLAVIIKQTYLLKILIMAGLLILISMIYYISKELVLQNTRHTSLLTMEYELSNALLPITNLLSRAKGNIDIAEYFGDSSVQPVLNYRLENNQHKLELVFLNPIYGLIDCSGDVINDAIYPIKINLIWQPINQKERTYNLVCERYNNYNPHVTNLEHNNYYKNVYKKTLLTNINAVKFRFLERSATGNINLANNPSMKTAAIQIGMVIQSSQAAYAIPQHSWYNLFGNRVQFFDNHNHQVIYITTNSNLT